MSSSLQSEPPPLLLLSAGAQTFGQQYFSSPKKLSSKFIFVPDIFGKHDPELELELLSAAAQTFGQQYFSPKKLRSKFISVIYLNNSIVIIVAFVII